MKTVEVVPHDPGWRDAFASEAQRIVAALDGFELAVHHIGSTSIPGIHAKPILDLLLEVPDLGALDASSAAMEALGYQVMGEFGIPGRRYFRRDDAAGVRTHQVHAFLAGSREVARHLAFRDYLRAHPDQAQRYSELKRALAAEHARDADAYMDGKDDFIREMDRRAAAWREKGTA
jgi:GrpB-like predicted nucleotidyltransferase (UPF0157 family)